MGCKLRGLACLLAAAAGTLPPATVSGPMVRLAAAPSAPRMHATMQTTRGVERSSPRLRGRLPVLVEKSIGFEVAEANLMRILGSTSAKVAEMQYESKLLGLPRVANGDASVLAILDFLETKTPPAKVDWKTLAGMWRLEYTDCLPAAVQEDIPMHDVHSRLIGLSVAVYISDSGKFDAAIDMSLAGGETKTVGLHRFVDNHDGSPVFTLSSQDGQRETIQVSYISEGLLVLRRTSTEGGQISQSGEYDGKFQRRPNVDVWRKIEEASAEVRPTTPVSLWRFGLPYYSFGRAHVDAGMSQVARAHASTTHYWRAAFGALILATLAAAVAGSSSRRAVGDVAAPESVTSGQVRLAKFAAAALASESSAQGVVRSALGDRQEGGRQRKAPKPLPEGSVYPAKDLCSLCGLCNTSHIGKVREACAFLGDGMGRIDEMETRVHGRRRDLDDEDELYFGVAEAVRPVRVKSDERPGKRAWTGVITRIACEMLEANLVDAVLCVASASPERAMEPRPMLARTVEEVLASGGVKPTLSPNLRPLEELRSGGTASDVRRLLFIGVGCQVQALRAIEEDLGLEKLYVLGTNCVDNPRDADALRRFLRSASDTPETAVGFEFMQDNRIHVKHSDGRYEKVPVFSLKEPHTCTGVIAKSCYSCFDYTNALTDLTVGYMAAPWDGVPMTEHFQYCVIRNPSGREMIDLLASKGALELGDAPPAGGGLARQDLIAGVLQPELDLAFGRREPRDGPPRWLAEILSEAITAFGPRGSDFAKASIDRATIRNIVCARAQGRNGRGRADGAALPAHAKAIEARYADLVRDFTEKYRGGTVM